MRLSGPSSISATISAFHVVGEGVESDEIASALTATGCEVAQGYLYARPMPKEGLSDWIVSREASTASQ